MRAGRGRPSDILRQASLIVLLAAVVAAGLRVFVDYDHGIWLVAYLLLVGFVAQYLLGRGQEILAPAAPARSIGWELVLWNVGILSVPAGVLFGVRLPVAFGSVTLVVALLLFALTVRDGSKAGDSRGGRKIELAYAALLVFMLVSVVTGMLLASDLPWFG